MYYSFARRFLFIFIGLFFLPLSYSQAFFCVNHEGYYNKGDAATLPESQTLSFDKMLNLIKRKKIDNVSDSIKEMNKKYKEYLKFHNLMYDSLSLQESSFKEPRAIVFGPDAQFVFTFNGGHHQNGGNALETMSVDKKTGKHQFREVCFKKEGKEGCELEPSDIAFQDSRIMVSKSNPDKCMQCHSGANWENYFLWPGSYGSNDDTLTEQFDREMFRNNPNYSPVHKTKKPVSLGRHFTLKDGVRDPEVEGYMSYLKGKKAHSRFKHLPDRPVAGPFREMMAGKKYSDIDWSKKFAKEREKVGGFWPSRPNLHFQDQLMKNNQKRTAKALADHKNSKKFIYMMKWLESCADLNNFSDLGVSSPQRLLKKIVNKELMKKMEKKLGSFKDYEKGFLKDELTNQKERISRFSDIYGKGNLVPQDYSDASAMGLGIRSRSGAYWKKDNKVFYKKKFPNLKVDSDMLLAMNMETSNLSRIAAGKYILDYYGFDLAPYSMNLRRDSTFHSGGLSCVVDAAYRQKTGKEIPSRDQRACDALRSKALSLGAAEDTDNLQEKSEY